MEKRLYFLIGDLLTNSVAGAVVALICTSVFSEAWPHPLAMVAGMFVGSAVGMLLAMLASVALPWLPTLASPCMVSLLATFE